MAPLRFALLDVGARFSSRPIANMRFDGCRGTPCGRLLSCLERPRQHFQRFHNAGTLVAGNFVEQ